MFQREVIGNVGGKPAYGNAVGVVNSFWRTSEIRAGIILGRILQRDLPDEWNAAGAECVNLGLEERPCTDMLGVVALFLAKMLVGRTRGRITNKLIEFRNANGIH